MPTDDAKAVASAYNDCQLGQWLPVTARFKASATVNSNDPDAAAREIRRVGSHPDLVQVLIRPAPVPPDLRRGRRARPAGGDPSGRRRRLDPTLRFVVIEAGVPWLPQLMWRMDKNYKALRDTTPWLTCLPSEYIVDHVRLTTQPIDEPKHPNHLNHLVQVLSMMSAEKTVMFSSDYPHWDNDDPKLILRRIDPAMRARIFGATAANPSALGGAATRGSRPSPA